MGFRPRSRYPILMIRQIAVGYSPHYWGGLVLVYPQFCGDCVT